jgi:Transposase DDE domain
VAAEPTEAKIKVDRLRNWKLLDSFRQALEPLVQERELPRSFSDSRRKLELAQYLSLFLFGLFNPCVRTLRGLCEISHLQRVEEEVCGRHVSLGSFSAMQHLREPGLLEAVFGQLSQEEPKGPGSALERWQWLAQDGSLFRALPRMSWALYGGGHQSRDGRANRAVKLHLSLNLVDDKPQQAAIHPGNVCERKVWRQQWRQGQAYVGDRLYGQEYRVFGQLEQKRCRYVLRLREEQAHIEEEQELPVSQAERAAGIRRQAWGRLGCRKRCRSVRLRLVWATTREGNVVLLATNLPPEDLAADGVWLLYKERWKIELFFRWLKCILGCRHWLAESPEGVAIQIYLALIAGLLLQLYLGRRPTKRMMELIQFHQMGLASDEELQAGLKRLLTQIEQRKKA